MAEERHGIERLRWLLEDDPHIAVGGHGYGPLAVPRFSLMSDKEVQIEVAQAVIEEIHDAIQRFDHPLIIVKEPPSI